MLLELFVQPLLQHVLLLPFLLHQSFLEHLVLQHLLMLHFHRHL